MTGIMNQCAKCGAMTEGGQFYRFYFGNVEEPDLIFQVKGSQEVYYCDCCLLRADARGQLIRSSMYLVLELCAITAVVFKMLVLGPGLWCELVIPLVIAVLGLPS